MQRSRPASGGIESTLERPAIVEVRLRLRFEGREWQVDRTRPRVRIGRAEDNDLVVGDVHTSRYHASITYGDGRFCLADDSRNGTIVTSRAGAACFVRREMFPLDGHGSVRLGCHDGPEVAFAVEVRSTDGLPWRASLPGVEDGTREGANVLRQEGDWWTVMYQGNVIRLKDARGVRYLAQLLRHPGQDFHVLDLAACATGADGVSRRSGDAAGGTGPVLDARAKSDYRRRLTDLRAELEEAERFNDLGRAARLRAEIDLVAGQLVGAVGMRGRDREWATSAERARVAVTRRIRKVVAKLACTHPGLGHHLESSVHTGRFCCYRPDPSHPVFWTA